LLGWFRWRAAAKRAAIAGDLTGGAGKFLRAVAAKVGLARDFATMAGHLRPLEIHQKQDHDRNESNPRAHCRPDLAAGVA